MFACRPAASQSFPKISGQEILKLAIGAFSQAHGGSAASASPGHTGLHAAQRGSSSRAAVRHGVLGAPHPSPSPWCLPHPRPQAAVAEHKLWKMGASFTLQLQHPALGTLVSITVTTMHVANNHPGGNVL